MERGRWKRGKGGGGEVERGRWGKRLWRTMEYITVASYFNPHAI